MTLTRTVCVLTLLNWKQKKPILFKVTEPSSCHNPSITVTGGPVRGLTKNLSRSDGLCHVSILIKPIGMDGFVKDEQNVVVCQPSLLPLNLLNVWLVPGQDTRVTHDITGNREVACELAPARVRKYQSPTSRLAERPTSY